MEESGNYVLRIFDEEEEAQAMQSIKNSSRMLQESIATGTAILSKYSQQRERLKVSYPNIHNKENASNGALQLCREAHREDPR
ncbi:putative membrin [Corchorus olitorius]|uniref:Membrin n=1 Tax=Corchorus olitorius TaxID=93759 RepID=A0A1R3HJF3_9ROSI|nr:putative membrin [Corchorus olitorius]